MHLRNAAVDTALSYMCMLAIASHVAFYVYAQVLDALSTQSTISKVLSKDVDALLYNCPVACKSGGTLNVAFVWLPALMNFLCARAPAFRAAMLEALKLGGAYDIHAHTAFPK